MPVNVAWETTNDVLELKIGSFGQSSMKPTDGNNEKAQYSLQQGTRILLAARRRRYAPSRDAIVRQGKWLGKF